MIIVVSKSVTKTSQLNDISKKRYTMVGALC